MSVFNVSISGLNAAYRRLEVSAQNVANRDSTRVIKNGQTFDEPYHAQRMHNVSNALGGVLVKVTDADPPTTVVFNPNAENADENGTSRVPNVELEREYIEQNIASYDVKANLRVIKVQNELFDSLLDIKS